MKLMPRSRASFAPRVLFLALRSYVAFQRRTYTECGNLNESFASVLRTTTPPHCSLLILPLRPPSSRIPRDPAGVPRTPPFFLFLRSTHQLRGTRLAFGVTSQHGTKSNNRSIRELLRSEFQPSPLLCCFLALAFSTMSTPTTNNVVIKLGLWKEGGTLLRSFVR